MSNETLFTQDDLIFAYTRQEAIRDGVLIDVSDMAHEASFMWPVAVTAAVHELIQRIPECLRGVQDVEGRLWDILWMAHCAANRGGVETMFDLLMDRNENGHRLRRLQLKMVSGPSSPNDPRPCLTIMLPEED